jgi:putative ABC transport system permease protein
VVVADVVNDLLGVSAYMNVDGLRRLTHLGPRASGAFLLTDGARLANVNAELKRAPSVASVVSPATMLASFESQLEESLFVAIGFIVAFASIISVAVIYNGTRIALSERGRELASLRVLGFTRQEVAALLFGEQAVITVLAIPIGWVSAQTYFWTAFITVLAAAASALLVRRRLNRMDLIAVLKTRE